MIFLFTHFFLLKQRNLSLHIMYSLHAAFPSGKCKIKESRSHVAIFWAEFHSKYSTIGVLSGPHEMLIYICLYSSKNFAVIDLNFRRLQKYVPCGPSMTDCLETSGNLPETYCGGFWRFPVGFQRFPDNPSLTDHTVCLSKHFNPIANFGYLSCL